MPFILTQGTSWIFGVVDCALASALDGKGEDCVLWHTDEIHSVMHEAERIMRALWLWASVFIFVRHPDSHENCIRQHWSPSSF